MNVLYSEPKKLELLKELGHGAFSRVLLVERKDRSGSWSEKFALKILNSKNLVEDCLLEYESLLRVNSKNCVRAFSWENFSGKPGLLTEFIDGPNLLQLFNSCPVNYQSKLSIFFQIYQGLTDLWSAGLVHGDLSPKNVLINEKGIVKLIDYGFGNENQNCPKYTPGFSAPETLNRSEFGIETDLYSLGSIAKYMGLKSEIYADLMHWEPKKRSLQKVKKNTNQVKYLNAPSRDLINLIQIWKNSVKEITSTRIIKTPKPRGASKLLIKLVTIAFVLFQIQGSKSHALNSMENVAWINFSPNNWHLIDLGNGERGYTPITRVPVRPGKVVMSWSRSEEKGEVTLTLKRGENRVLSVDEL